MANKRNSNSNNDFRWTNGEDRAMDGNERIKKFRAMGKQPKPKKAKRRQKDYGDVPLADLPVEVAQNQIRPRDTDRPVQNIARKRLSSSNYAIDKDDRREEIEKDILMGQSMTQIADKYGYSHMTILRYKNDILLPRVRLAHYSKDKELKSEARRRMDWLFEQAEDTLAMAKIDGQYSAAASIMGVAKGAIELLMEVDGELNRNAQPAAGNPIIAVLAIPKTWEVNQPIPKLPSRGELEAATEVVDSIPESQNKLPLLTEIA